MPRPYSSTHYGRYSTLRNLRNLAKAYEVATRSCEIGGQHEESLVLLDAVQRGSLWDLAHRGEPAKSDRVGSLCGG